MSWKENINVIDQVISKLANCGLLYPPTPTLTPKSAAPAAGSAPTIAQEKKDEKELEEWDEDMRFGLFN